MTQPLSITMTQQPAYDGRLAKLVELNNARGMRVTFMDIGATWLSCQVPVSQEERREVLLGVSSMADFMRQQCYMGATVGRYANRIAHGRFTLQGKTFQVTTNQAGHCLHGGLQGFDKRRWHIAVKSQQSVTFSLLSPDGDQGFPGNLAVHVTYTLTNDNQVTIHYRATTDRATPVNLTNHAYFNLQGEQPVPDCRSHFIKIAAEQYLPINAEGIPLGHLQAVSGSALDLREQAQIGERLLCEPQQIAVKGFDHCYLFASGRKLSEPVAKVVSADQKVRMLVTTDKPAMQLYTGNWLAGTPDRSGGTYQDYAGLALETQFYPDSPNHEEWTQSDCILHPRQEYVFNTGYQFVVA
ncbi:Aldose 1-epimerase [Plesiomonas shigelloides]|uniref:galactose-1-epimerase n=1 Tax=Plesiomonas shigelloides TaxID=703 RepID=UPI000D845CE2|nr:galactose-1-epimerase [Plesiomonas shigelloides]SPZ45726.1 Aldose 1-epimerase [Plesiomonas shigelloides]